GRLEEGQFSLFGNGMEKEAGINDNPSRRCCRNLPRKPGIIDIAAEEASPADATFLRGAPAKRDGSLGGVDTENVEACIRKKEAVTPASATDIDDRRIFRHLQGDKGGKLGGNVRNGRRPRAVISVPVFRGGFGHAFLPR